MVPGLVVLAWALAVAAATTLAWLAVVTIGGEHSREAGVLTRAEVSAALAAQGPLPSPAPPSPAPRAPTVGSSPDAPTAVARTWETDAGRVAAECVAGEIALLYATPSDGWSVDVRDTGPERVKVEFSSDEDDVVLSARCSDGVPEHHVRSND
ncbi:hypothetical protein GCM10009790_40330 [Georgenia ruanii]|uniref:Septum formation initiator n=2 Tax=Georgenia ruanii TaxID=348442 RepID=A0A7J9V0W7_9MICO|nr:hypothetical protein [Georgenia ruanii]